MTDQVLPAVPASDASPKRRRRPARTLLAVAMAAVLLLMAAVILDRLLTGTSVVGDVQRQPASVRYSDGATHYVGVTHTHSGLFDRHLGYHLYTGSDPDLGYGYFIRLGLGSPERRPAIKAVKWDDEGVLVTFASGHEVFVPVRYFVGGR